MVLDNFCNYLEHKEVQFYFMFKVDLNILNKIIKLVKEFLKKKVIFSLLLSREGFLKHNIKKHMKD